MNAQNKFGLGRIFVTPGVKQSLQSSEVRNAVIRHSHGDWGDLCLEDAQANERAMLGGERVFSVYHSSGGQKFWVITEADRTTTTVLLPEEY